MAGKMSLKSANVGSPGKLSYSKATSKIHFRATLLRPKATAKVRSWTFLILPKEASAKLPSRSMTSVEGTFNGLAFQATLEPDGQGGHWLKVDRKMREEAGADAGDVVTLEIAPVAEEPEPKVPADLRKAIVAAPPGARKVWSDITPIGAEIGFTGSSPPSKQRHARVGSELPATCSPKESDARAASIGLGCIARALAAP